MKAITEAIERRCRDYGVVREWVFREINSNLPSLAKDLACALSADDTEVDATAAAWLARLRERIAEDIAEQDATRALARAIEAERIEEQEEAA